MGFWEDLYDLDVDNPAEWRQYLRDLEQPILLRNVSIQRKSTHHTTTPEPLVQH
jgi:hypothetical protein